MSANPKLVNMNINQAFFAPNVVFERLRARCTVRRVKESVVIFTQGEMPRQIILLLSGGIALTPDAMEPSLCRVAGPGSILGLPANLCNQPYSLTAVTVGACDIAVLPRKLLLEFLQQNPETALGIARMLARELEQMQNQAVQIRLESMHESPSYPVRRGARSSRRKVAP